MLHFSRYFIEGTVKNGHEEQDFKLLFEVPFSIKDDKIPKSDRYNSGLLEKPDIIGGGCGCGCDVLGHLRWH